MCEGSFLPSSFGPHQKHTEFESSLRSYPINLSRFLRKGGQSCGPYHDRRCLVADDSSLASPTHRKPRWVGGWAATVCFVPRGRVGQPPSLASGRKNCDLRQLTYVASANIVLP